MKKVALVIAAVVMAALSISAVADAQKGKPKKGEEPASRPLPPRPEFTTGIVSSYVAESRMLKLNTGGEYKLTQAAGATVFKPGDKVQLRWMMHGGIRIADQATMTLQVEKASGDKTPPPADKASTDKPATPPAGTPAPSDKS
jgi:hypothetical protein